MNSAFSIHCLPPSGALRREATWQAHKVSALLSGHAGARNQACRAALPGCTSCGSVHASKSVMFTVGTVCVGYSRGRSRSWASEE